MTVEFRLNEEVSKEVRYLQAECGVRYWEDASVNGAEDTDGTLIPLRVGDEWRPIIDLTTGFILGWPTGTAADVHYKVCDAGIYKLLDVDKNVVHQIDGYVPDIMSPGGAGYGDYVIMTIGSDGHIENWSVDLEDFERKEA